MTATCRTRSAWRGYGADRRRYRRAHRLMYRVVVTKIIEVGTFWEAEAEDQGYLQHYPAGNNQFRR